MKLGDLSVLALGPGEREASDVNVELLETISPDDDSDALRRIDDFERVDEGGAAPGEWELDVANSGGKVAIRT